MPDSCIWVSIQIFWLDVMFINNYKSVCIWTGLRENRVGPLCPSKVNALSKYAADGQPSIWMPIIDTIFSLFSIHYSSRRRTSSRVRVMVQTSIMQLVYILFLLNSCSNARNLSQFLNNSSIWSFQKTINFLEIIERFLFVKLLQSTVSRVRILKSKSLKITLIIFDLSFNVGDYEICSLNLSNHGI